MSQTAGLTTLSEDDIETHRATAQQMVTRIVVVPVVCWIRRSSTGEKCEPLAHTRQNV